MEIRGSRWRLALLSLLGIGMTALGAWIALGDVAQGGSLAEFAGWAGMLLFGGCSVIGCHRLLTANRVVLTLSPAGIRDRRVAKDFIPWTAVRGLSTWSMQGQKVLVVDVDPEAESKLTLTRLARWSRAPNRALGADGLCIAAAGLNMSYDALYEAAVAYFEAAHRR